MEREIRTKRGCSCCSFILLGFFVWLFLVIGPFFPKRSRPPYSLYLLGSSHQRLFLALNERRQLSFFLRGRNGLLAPYPLKVELRASAKAPFALQKGKIVALRAGHGILFAKAQLAHPLRSMKRQHRSWQQKIDVWISSWRLIGEFEHLFPSQKEHDIRYQLLFWKKHLHVLAIQCRQPHFSRCQRRWLLLSYRKNRWISREFSIPKEGKYPAITREFCGALGSKIYFMTTHQAYRFKAMLWIFDLDTHRWRREKGMPALQCRSSFFLHRKRLFLFGGASRFTNYGGKKIQFYDFLKKRWGRWPDLPDNSWDNDSVTFFDSSFYLLNRKGRLWRLKPTHHWQTMAPFPRRRKELFDEKILLSVFQKQLLAIRLHSHEIRFQVWAYSPKDNRWKIHSSLPYGFQKGADLRSFQNHLYIVGQRTDLPNKIAILKY